MASPCRDSIAISYQGRQCVLAAPHHPFCSRCSSSIASAYGGSVVIMYVCNHVCKMYWASLTLRLGSSSMALLCGDSGKLTNLTSQCSLAAAHPRRRLAQACKAIQAHASGCMDATVPAPVPWSAPAAPASGPAPGRTGLGTWRQWWSHSAVRGTTAWPRVSVRSVIAHLLASKGLRQVHRRSSCGPLSLSLQPNTVRQKKRTTHLPATPCASTLFPPSAAP